MKLMLFVITSAASRSLETDEDVRLVVAQHVVVVDVMPAEHDVDGVLVASDVGQVQDELRTVAEVHHVLRVAVEDVRVAVVVGDGGVEQLRRPVSVATVNSSPHADKFLKYFWKSS